MASSKTSPVKILEHCRVTPFPPNSHSQSESTLPLTFFDTFLLTFSPVECLFFYQLSTNSTPTHFNSLILPKLKHSLSLTLTHFPPLAGTLTWPPHSLKPIILTTLNDAVPMSLAFSTADFAQLSNSNFRDAAESHLYIPELLVSDSAASPLALQITFFPNQGFSIGISFHHTILDGTSILLFMKAWAHITQQLGNYINNDNSTLISLPKELTPSFDRSVVYDPEGLDLEFLTSGLGKESIRTRSLKLFPVKRVQPGLVRAEFEFSCQDINKLRERVKGYDDKPLYLSSFVLTYSFTSVCLIKAKGIELDKEVILGFMADCRSRLDPPIPSTYFGNCLNMCTTRMKMRELVEAKDGVALVAERVGELVKGIGKEEGGIRGGMKDMCRKIKEPSSVENGVMITVAGSTRFEAYRVDFGWGKPEKVEISSIDGTGAFSIMESRDGDGGIEIGLALERREMELFQSFFVDGLGQV